MQLHRKPSKYYKYSPTLKEKEKKKNTLAGTKNNNKKAFA